MAEIDAMTLPHMCHGRARVTAPGLMRRESPGVSGRPLGSWAAGAEVYVWAVDGEWWLVQDVNGPACGWSHGRYLATVGELTR